MGRTAKRTISRGKCTLCGAVLAKNVMTKHLQTHERAAQREKSKGSAFHLVVEGRRDPVYWLHLSVPQSATLEDLDRFLRDIWLECCGHMSAFTINGRQYASSPDPDYDNKGTNSALSRILASGMRFTHEYDFGTTTELTLKVVGVRETIHKQEIVILARNETPEIICGNCSERAAHICTECGWGSGGYLCAIHAKSHEHDEDMFLPVVNSPRMGECGYTG